MLCLCLILIQFNLNGKNCVDANEDYNTVLNEVKDNYSDWKVVLLDSELEVYERWIYYIDKRKTRERSEGNNRAKNCTTKTRLKETRQVKPPNATWLTARRSVSPRAWKSWHKRINTSPTKPTISNVIPPFAGMTLPPFG